MAEKCRLQLDDLGEVLGTGETLGEVEAGIKIALGNFDEFAVEGSSALAGCVEGTLERINGLFQRIFAALIGFARLGHGLLGESAYALRHGGVERQLLKLLGAFAEGIARLLGGGLRTICSVHVFTFRLGASHPLGTAGGESRPFHLCCTAIIIAAVQNSKSNLERLGSIFSWPTI